MKAVFDDSLGLCYNSYLSLPKALYDIFLAIDIWQILKSTGLIGPAGRVEQATAWTCYYTPFFFLAPLI